MQTLQCPTHALRLPLILKSHVFRVHLLLDVNLFGAKGKASLKLPQLPISESAVLSLQGSGITLTDYGYFIILVPRAILRRVKCNINEISHRQKTIYSLARSDQ